MKTLITNGIVFDGSGSKGVPGSVAIEDQRIIGIGTIETNGFDRVLDAHGAAISPGFIDTHSHSDVAVFTDPMLPPKVMQGITTDILGQDGIAPAPLPTEFISPWRKNLGGIAGDDPNMRWDFINTDGYLKQLASNGSALNLAYCVPHGNVRMEAMGLNSGFATAQQRDAMRTILRRELEAGGIALSTGLIYMPCAYSDTAEMVAICSEAARFDRPLVIHQRSEADTIIDSMREVIDIGRESGIAVHFSHFKICGKTNADKFEPVIALLEEAKSVGIRVSFDQYPYVAGSTMLGVILPPWAHDGGTDKLLTRLADPASRKKMIEDIAQGIQGWDNFVQFAGLDGIFVTSVQSQANQWAIGKNLVQLGEAKGKSPLEATFDLLYEESNLVGMVDFYGLEEHVKAFISRPEMNVCTDGLLGGEPHPRVFGAFARFFGKYIREEKVLSLEEGIRKATLQPATVFKIKERGLLKTGYYADITVFDPATIIDNGTYTQPRQHPSGIHHVIVNGEIMVQDGVLQRRESAYPGMVLRA